MPPKQPLTVDAAKDQPDPTVLKKMRARFSIELHPSKLENVTEGVREQLNASLVKYSEDFQGVVLAYTNERILSKQAVVHPYFPLCHVDVVADVLLFQPVVGGYLVGKVNSIGNDYISMLVMGVFNAVIEAESIRKEFKCNFTAQEWRSTRDSSHAIGLGSDVQFRVDKLLDLDPHFQIQGSLKDPATGEVDHVEQQQPQQQQQAGGHKRQKQEQQQANGHADPEQARSSKKDKKKEKQRQQQEQEQQQAAQQAAQQEQQQAKSRKKDKKKAKHQEANGTAAAAAATPAATPAAEQSSKKSKDKKKDKDKGSEQQAAAAAAAAGPNKGDKKRKDKGDGAKEQPPAKKSKQHKDKGS